MATIANRTARVQHYASLLMDGEEIYGVATLVPGGYSFRPDDERNVMLVSYKSADLMLYGRCNLADAQHATDKAQWQEEGFTIWQEVL